MFYSLQSAVGVIATARSLIHRQTGEKMLLPGVGSFLGAAVAALGVILAIIIAVV
ncbi:hypothetical protein ABZ942_05875 [Nocardia sp. NPDC046473]|uniref:hypothetical protein n=1 Tax=Nocardia sp. NPDC046473 TaxID=3155733 RepID=UPI0033CD644E